LVLVDCVSPDVDAYEAHDFINAYTSFDLVTRVAPKVIWQSDEKIDVGVKRPLFGGDSVEYQGIISDCLNPKRWNVLETK